MSWGEPKGPNGSTARERDLENDLTRIALVCNRAVRESKALPADEAATYLGDALRAVEKIASGAAVDEEAT